MSRLLEVIVTSVEEAREAELGGADRLELVRALELGGLTPDPSVVEAMVRSVPLPVRVMVRENASMTAHPEEVGRLRSAAREFAQWPIDGLVVGFVKDACLDWEALGEVFGAAPETRVTMHRAFEQVADPAAAIEQLKRHPQVDRILTSGGAGNWEQRKRNLLAWQKLAAPEITILVGVGLRTAILTEISQSPGDAAGTALHPSGFEFHVGRAARLPQTAEGVVSRDQVAHLKALA